MKNDAKGQCNLMDGVKWIKLSTDVFDNRKIKQIEALPDGDALIVIWLKLLILAGKSNENGYVYFADDLPYTNEMLAIEFQKPLNKIEYALNVFEKFKMITIINDIVCVSNWAKYQNIDGLEKVREQGRKRVQAYRERQKIALLEGDDDCNVTCNVTVTQSSISNISNISNSKSNKHIDNTPVIYQLMLNDGSYYDVHQSEIDELKDIYQNVNLEYEFKRMIRWIKDNPTKRKTKRGISKFISSWLDKEQNRYHGNNYKQQPQQTVLPENDPWKELDSIDDF